jgi:hypothetical protein
MQIKNNSLFEKDHTCQTFIINLLEGSYENRTLHAHNMESLLFNFTANLLGGVRFSESQKNNKAEADIFF